MIKRIWDKFLTERDRQVFAAAGYGAPQGFGQRPALVEVARWAKVGKEAGVRIE
jgi:hypothetical protein